MRDGVSDCRGGFGYRDPNGPSATFQIFFPPMPPVLWSTRSTAAETRTDELSAPPGLAVFVTEPFYAPLSTRMAKSEIGDSLAFRLETYRAKRTALLAELRARLDTLGRQILRAGSGRWREFSGEQTPRIAALEKEAENESL